MARAFIVVMLLALLPVSATAQWRVGAGSEIFDGFQSAFGVTSEGGALGVLCAEGQPFLWTQGWAPAVGGAERAEPFAIIVDGNRFAINGTHVPPDGLWYGTPPSSLIDALKAGSQASIETASQPQVTVPLRGSSRALSSVLAGCGGASATIPPAPTGQSTRFDAVLREACGGGYTLADGAEFTGLLDGDDRPDTVLDWAGVSCADRIKGRGAGFCGAALCRIELGFSETGGAQQIMGVNPVLVDRAFGLSALQTTTQGATCGGAAQVCDVIWTWTGNGMEPAP